jgi:hypothetical protein
VKDQGVKNRRGKSRRGGDSEKIAKLGGEERKKQSLD